MLEIRIKQTKFCLDFTFAAVLAFYFWLDSEGWGVVSIVLCMLHELAHLAVMCACGISPERITMYGGGIRISSSQVESCAGYKKLAIYSAGCAVNFILCAVLFSFQRNAAILSLFMGIFNLLPIGEFDGAQLLKCLLIKFCPPERIDAVMRAVGVITVILCGVIIAAVQGQVSITLLSAVLYLTIVVLHDM